MADSTCLAGHAAAVDAADDIELFAGACKSERLADDELEGLKAEIIVNPATRRTLATDVFLRPVP